MFSYLPSNKQIYRDLRQAQREFFLFSSWWVCWQGREREVTPVRMVPLSITSSIFLQPSLRTCGIMTLRAHGDTHGSHWSYATSKLLRLSWKVWGHLQHSKLIHKWGTKDAISKKQCGHSFTHMYACGHTELAGNCSTSSPASTSFISKLKT